MKESDMKLEAYDHAGNLTHVNGVAVSRQLVNTSLQPATNALVALSDDFAGYSMEPSEALIRAREATIAGQYVTGLDAENQVRAGQHDDWLPLQIAYNALLTKDIDVDVLKKYHAPGQLALAKADQRPVVVRARRSPWDAMMIKIGRWFDIKFNRAQQTKNEEIAVLKARVRLLENSTKQQVIDPYAQRQREMQARLAELRLDQDDRLKAQRAKVQEQLDRVRRPHRISYEIY